MGTVFLCSSVETLQIMKVLLLTAVIVSCVQIGWGKSTFEDDDTEIEEKQFGILGTGFGTGTDTSVTIGNFGLVQLGALLFPLIAIGGALLLYLFAGEEDSGYSSYGYTSYARSVGQKNPYGFNWESLNILDWISMGQEAWEKYDPNNVECQKRLICEIHQNQSKFGGPANTMVQLFGYLHYAEILSLPDELKIMLEEYADASEKGRTMQKDCGEVYEGCDFSVNGVLSKFSTNEV